MDRELWERAQRQLRDGAAKRRERPTKATPSPLAGKLFDENGECLYVAGAAKRERRYRYYVSRGLIAGSAEKVGNGGDIRWLREGDRFRYSEIDGEE
jgi:site-specific DNA recombinase